MPGFLTTAQVIAIRKVANRGLFRTFSILRKTRVENDFGFADTWPEVGTGLGWLRMMNKPHTTEQLGHIEGAESKYRLHSEFGTDIREGDRISMEGHLYEVHDTNTDDSIQIYRTALLELLQ